MLSELKWFSLNHAVFRERSEIFCGEFNIFTFPIFLVCTLLLTSHFLHRISPNTAQPLSIFGVMQHFRYELSAAWKWDRIITCSCCDGVWNYGNKYQHFHHMMPNEHCTPSNSQNQCTSHCRTLGSGAHESRWSYFPAYQNRWDRINKRKTSNTHRLDVCGM